MSKQTNHSLIQRDAAQFYGVGTDHNLFCDGVIDRHQLIHTLATFKSGVVTMVASLASVQFTIGELFRLDSQTLQLALARLIRFFAIGTDPSHKTLGEDTNDTRSCLLYT